MNHGFSGKAGQLLDECIADYDSTIWGISPNASGGTVRGVKGAMTERIVRILLQSAWISAGKSEERLQFNLHSKYDIPIRREYVEKIADTELRRKILANLGEYKVEHGTDIHVYIDEVFALSVECKAFTENAMLKRILFDAFLLGTRFPNLRFALVQMENNMGGDYGTSELGAVSGSPQSHTLMSYMDSVNLHVITLLEGDRKAKCPIHKSEFYKPLKRDRLETAASVLAELLENAKSA